MVHTSTLAVDDANPLAPRFQAISDEGIQRSRGLRGGKPVQVNFRFRDESITVQTPQRTRGNPWLSQPHRLASGNGWHYFERIERGKRGTRRGQRRSDPWHRHGGRAPTQWRDRIHRGAKLGAVIGMFRLLGGP